MIMQPTHEMHVDVRQNEAVRFNRLLRGEELLCHRHDSVAAGHIKTA